MKGEGQALVPRLRFPEFRDAGEWDVQPLGEVCEVLNNRRKPITSSNRISGPYPYYGASGIVDYVADFIFDERLVLVGEDGAKWGTFEKTAFIAEGKYWVNNHAHVLKSLGMNDVLLEAYLTMLDVGPYINGAAPPKLTLGKLKQIPVVMPVFAAEQQKIADCLSSLNALIAAQAEKVDALKTHKKGLMQQLFPCEGETVPRLRFPEFRDAGEWRKTHIGKICQTYSGGTPSSTNKKYYGGKIPFIRSAEIDKDRTELSLTKEGLQESSANMVRKGDILYALYGANSGEVAIAKIDGAINQAILCLKSEGSNNFIYQFLSFNKNRIIDKYIQGGQGNLSGEIVKSIAVSLPELNEQQKIADCLSSLDALITAHTEKLEALKSHKKGLMQQLFPSPEAVSA